MSHSPQPLSRRAIIAGRYVIQERLGSGSLGTAYLARDSAEERLVTLKIIRSEHLITETIFRMQVEFQAIASLRHPQVAQAYDFGYTDAGGIPYYTREYIQGSPLPAGPPGSEAPAAYLAPMLDLLEALEYVHAQGILHLDLHAGNLIVADDLARGSVVIDFGLARSAEKPLTTAGLTWSALPPELLDGKEPTARTDVYQAGRLLQYRLTGQALGKPVLPREIPGWGTRLTLDLERILLKALHAAPEQRFASAAELRAALLKVLGRTQPAPGRSQPHAAILGRAAELKLIDHALAESAAGKPSVLWLSSAPGLGKTRLLSEAKLRAQLRGLPTAEVRCADSSSEPALPRSLRFATPRVHGSWLDVLSPRLGGAPAERARRCAEAYFAEGGKPLAIFLDDADLADRESQILLDALVAECSRRRREGIDGRGLCILLACSRCPTRKDLRSLAWQWPVKSIRPLPPPLARRLFQAFVQPLPVAEPLARQAVARARGSPRILRHMALAWRESASQGDTAQARLPPDLPTAGFADGARLDPADAEALRVLSVLDRPTGAEELATVLEARVDDVARSLRRLLRLEAIASQGRGRSRRYRSALRKPGGGAPRGAPSAEERRLHERAARLLEAKAQTTKGLTAVDREHLARHLLACGKPERGVQAAMDAAAVLRVGSAAMRAVQLLEQASLVTSDVRQRLLLVEEMSSILEEMGDHEKGIAILEPLCHAGCEGLTASEHVRLRRRLGINYHRAGRARDALRVFEEAQAMADPAIDLESLVFIDTELSELHIFLGSQAEAEQACRRGLERLRRPGLEAGFRRRMETMLRASLGHIELRRVRLPQARAELEKALRLSHRSSPRAERAAILHNLAIAESELNDFTAATRRFDEVRRLLERAGEHREVIKVLTNLTLIAAKLGDRDKAREHVRRAEELQRSYPGPRLECFIAYSGGIAAHLAGEAEAAMAALERAVALAQALEDNPLLGFARVALAEACLTCGRYARAAGLLWSAAEQASRGGLPVLQRMASARLLLVERLLGRARLERQARRALEAVPRTGILYLETWNDLFLGLADLAAGVSGAERLASAVETFHHLRVPAGERAARVALLLDAYASGDLSLLRARLEAMEDEAPQPQLFLRVAELLAKAEAHLALGDLERCEESIGAAQAAIVGSPFLELDWRIELVRTRVSIKKGDLQEARRNLHQALHSRALLLQLVPASSRARFLAHSRFAPLEQAASRLHASPATERRTKPLRPPVSYEGMVGQAPAMLQLFAAIERLRDQDLPVLILGETGTGKELAARAIRERSPRRGRSFQSLHAACLPPELFEAELFGHEAGAFTGAEKPRSGLLEDVHGGTLLLDEVGQMPAESQAKLLRFLDAGSFRRLGGTSPRHVDVRLIATSSVDLREAAARGAFRADLYYRLAGVELRLPALRERKQDIPLLVRHFLERHASRLDRPACTLSAEALALLERQEWPGNVRELEMLLLRAAVHLPAAATIGRRELEPLLAAAAPLVAAPRDLMGRPLDAWRRELEAEYLQQLFRKHAGDTAAMMRQLGVKTTKLYGWLRELGLDVRDLRKGL